MGASGTKEDFKGDLHICQGKKYPGVDKPKGHHRASEQAGQPGGGGAAPVSWPHEEAAVQGQSTG